MFLRGARRILACPLSCEGKWAARTPLRIRTPLFSCDCVRGGFIFFCDGEEKSVFFLPVCFLRGVNGRQRGFLCGSLLLRAAAGLSRALCVCVCKRMLRNTRKAVCVLTMDGRRSKWKKKKKKNRVRSGRSCLPPPHLSCFSCGRASPSFGPLQQHSTRTRTRCKPCPPSPWPAGRPAGRRRAGALKEQRKRGSEHAFFFFGGGKTRRPTPSTPQGSRASHKPAHERALSPPARISRGDASLIDPLCRWHARPSK